MENVGGSFERCVSSWGFLRLILARKKFDWSGFESEYISICCTDLRSSQQLAKCSLRLHFLHRLWYAGYYPHRWQLVQNLYELKCNCLQRGLYCSYLYSLRLVWECVPCLSTFYERNVHFWDLWSCKFLLDFFGRLTNLNCLAWC